jgi:hypothetical protein
MRLLTTLLTACVIASPAMAQTKYAVFSRSTAKTTQTITDPSNTADLTTTTTVKSTELDWIVRDVVANTETVIRTVVIGSQRFYKLNTATVDVDASVIFSAVPADGARIAEDPVAIAETSTSRDLLQRAPLSTTAAPKNYLFHLRRLSEGSTNPLLSQTQYYGGLQTPILLPISLETVSFPKTMTGVMHRWESRTYGVNPYRTLPVGRAVALVNASIKCTTDTKLMDQIMRAENVIPDTDNPEGLRVGTPAYAVRVVTYNLERGGYVNYDLR